MRLTEEAEQDLLTMFLFGFEAFGVAQARKYYTGMHPCFSLLAENPRLGRKADSYAPGARRHEHGQYVIFYDEAPTGVLIIAVLHNRSTRLLT